MSQVSNLSAIASLADEVCKASNTTGFQIFAVAPHSSATLNAANVFAKSVSQNSLDSLAAMITHLSKQVKTL